MFLGYYNRYRDLPEDCAHGDTAMVAGKMVQRIGTIEGRVVNVWIPQEYAERVTGVVVYTKKPDPAGWTDNREPANDPHTHPPTANQGDHQ